MKKNLSHRHVLLKKQDNNLAISKIASEKINKGMNVINATIGMFFDEHKHLADFDIVDKVIANSYDEKTKKYGTVTGGNLFKESIIKWVFNNVDCGENNLSTIATIGATGALSISFRNYTEKGQDIILPNIRWSSYDNITNLVECNVKEYNLFKGNRLDINSIKECVTESIKSFGRCYLLINDPCHNPTGYTISIDEWEILLTFLRDISKQGPVVLMDDIAYLNFNSEDYSEVLTLMNQYVSDSFIIQFAFSASKTLSIYGLRGGALICLAKNKVDIDDFDEMAYASARTMWSMPNNIANNVIIASFLDNENNVEIRNTLSKYKLMLKHRSDLFLSLLDKHNIKHEPYKCGFFIYISCNNPEKISNNLIKQNIFVVPMGNGLRISLSSVPLNEIESLAYALIDSLDGENNERNN